MAIDLEKLLNYLQRKTADTHELQAAKTILELIERLEAAEKQRDELESTLRMEETISFRRQMQEYAAQRDELLSAVELYEEALKASWPSDVV